MRKTRTVWERALLQGAVVLLLFVGCQPVRTLAFMAYEDRISEGTNGIRLLTDETRQQAIACGEAGAECALMPYLLCASNRRYAVRLATPYSRIAFSAYEAQRTHRQARPPSRGAANHWGVGLFVSPSNDPQQADSIEKVFIRRGSEIIQPATITLAPVVVTRGNGSQVRLSKGFFAFPMDAFRPTSDITLVFVGPSGEMTCGLDQGKLSALR